MFTFLDSWFRFRSCAGLYKRYPNAIQIAVRSKFRGTLTANVQSGEAIISWHSWDLSTGLIVVADILKPGHRQLHILGLCSYERWWNSGHYNDVIMSAMASQIISVSIVYSTVCFGVDRRKHAKLRVTGLCAGNSPVIGEYPAQRATNTEIVSILWRHHGNERKSWSWGKGEGTHFVMTPESIVLTGDTYISKSFHIAIYWKIIIATSNSELTGLNKRYTHVWRDWRKWASSI